VENGQEGFSEEMVLKLGIKGRGNNLCKGREE